MLGCEVYTKAIRFELIKFIDYQQEFQHEKKRFYSRRHGDKCTGIRR